MLLVLDLRDIIFPVSTHPSMSSALVTTGACEFQQRGLSINID